MLQMCKHWKAYQSLKDRVLKEVYAKGQWIFGKRYEGEVKFINEIATFDIDLDFTHINFKDGVVRDDALDGRWDLDEIDLASLISILDELNLYIEENKHDAAKIGRHSEGSSLGQETDG